MCLPVMLTVSKSHVMVVRAGLCVCVTVSCSVYFGAELLVSSVHSSVKQLEVGTETGGGGGRARGRYWGNK